jgi:hypothetical protein
MSQKLKFLALALLLAVFVGTNAYAQSATGESWGE